MPVNSYMTGNGPRHGPHYLPVWATMAAFIPEVEVELIAENLNTKKSGCSRWLLVAMKSYPVLRPVLGATTGDQRTLGRALREGPSENPGV